MTTLARYDAQDPRNIEFHNIRAKAAQDAERQDAVIQDLGLLEMALNDIDDRYMNYLKAGNFFSAQIEDRLRLLVKQEIREIRIVLGWPDVV